MTDRFTIAKTPLYAELGYSSSPVVTATLLTTLAELDALHLEWDELLEDSNTQCRFFLRWSWNSLWWTNYAPEESRLNLIACRDEGGHLVGVAPFYWRQCRLAGFPPVRELLFLGTGIEILTSEHLDIIVRRGYEQAVAEAISNYLRRRKDWDRLWLWYVSSASKVLPYLHRALGERVKLVVCDRLPFIKTRMDWEAVKQGLGNNLRKNIERYSRRLLKSHDCYFHLVRTPEELGPAIDNFIRLHQAYWQSKGQSGVFALRNFERFLCEEMRRSLAEGRLRLWLLYADGQCVATLLAFLDNGIAHYFQGGSDPAFAKLRIGVLMLNYCIRDCIEDEMINEFDFMGGESSYKYHWTKMDREAIELEIWRLGFRSTLYKSWKRGRRMAAWIWYKLKPLSTGALVGFQGRGFADGVQLDFGLSLFLEALIFL